MTFLYWAGYLYRTWSLAYDETPEEIYRQAPMEVLQHMFLGPHVMSCQMAIENLKEMYQAYNKIRK